MSTADDSPGNDAGWYLRFFTEPAAGVAPQSVLIGARDYYAEIDATLATGLDGGVYRFSIEGITNDHYGRLKDMWGKQPLYVDLYLYWRDTGGPLAYLESLAGLTDSLDGFDPLPPEAPVVARLQVTRLGRRVGARRYEAVIEAQERVFMTLAQPPQKTPASGPNALAMISAVLDRFDVDYSTYGGGNGSGGAAPDFKPSKTQTGLQALAALEPSLVEQMGKTGRGQYLIRDGELHVGKRPIPLSGSAKAISDATGLAHVETTGASQSPADDASTPSKARLQYSLTLKGRPDLKPGDRVGFTDPFDDAQGNPIDQPTTTPSSFGAALAGLGQSLFGGAENVGGGKIDLYVSGVHHRLSRSDGFVTTVTGVAIDGDGWDDVPKKGGRVDRDPAATPHAAVADAIQDLMTAAAGAPLTVGEVRAVNSKGSDEPPGQTVDVWVGLAAGDGVPYRAWRLAVDRDSKARATGVPYATPFAWGKCGLVLPRYPGTRVLVAHAGDRADDPVEVGALWPSGHGPDSQPGDWWLILPAAVDGSKRQSAGDDETPDEPSGKATNDLIDADGARTIEVGKLVVRVLPTKLAAPGTRPAAPDDSAAQVMIEHESGSRIVIRDSGEIVIHAKDNLTLESQKDVNISAKNVKVTLGDGGTMDVS